MAWSKFDPEGKPPSAKPGADSSAGRRIWLLKWGWWITLVYTAVGFGLIAFWLFHGR